MDTVDLVISSAKAYYDETQNTGNSRYRSWEHCYKCFHDARTNRSLDYDYLSLQLGFYLASWGMYRGSSFLLQKDYKVHIPVVEELLKQKYNKLLGCEYTVLEDKVMQDTLEGLRKCMEDHYNEIRKSVKESVEKNTSQTLITKILMGTLGCAPAYDEYFRRGIIDQKVSTGNFNIKSLLRLVEFYKDNHEKLEETRQNFKVDNIPYPQMKLLDMGFWQIGLKHQ